MTETIARVRIEGRVQGVWFRAWTAEEARSRNLRGWVRNRADGSVEALFAGDDAAVEEMIAACRHGSPLAKVTSVRRFEATADDFEGEGFVQRPTR